MTFHIAPAEPADLDGLIASAAALFAEDGGTRDPYMDTSWPERSGAPYYRAIIDQDDALALLAFDNPQKSRVIGHLTGRVGAPNEVRSGVRVATLMSLRVDAAHRRQGVAGALVAAFFEWAEQQGADETAVTAYASNADAIAFYHRMGFADYDLTLHRNVRRATPR